MFFLIRLCWSWFFIQIFFYFLLHKNLNFFSNNMSDILTIKNRKKKLQYILWDNFRKHVIFWVLKNLGFEANKCCRKNFRTYGRSTGIIMKRKKQLKQIIMQSTWKVNYFFSIEITNMSMLTMIKNLLVSYHFYSTLEMRKS